MQGKEVKLAGYEINNCNYYYSCQHLHSSCAPDEENNSINDDSDYHYIDYVLPSEGAEKVKHESGAEKIPV